MKRFLVGVTVAALVAVMFMPVATMATGTTFPYWTEGAHNEDEQQSRLAFIDRKISEFTDRRDAIVDRKAELRSRIRKLDRRLDRIRGRIDKHRGFRRRIREVTGYASQLYGMRLCESTNNYQAHSPTGTYHGGYQYDISTWGGYGGYGDAHAAPWYLQDARTAEYLKAGQASRWPNC
jgi:hypothetical protein